MSVNKVILIGRLGAEPEIRYTLEGKPVASLRVATNEVIMRGGNKETLTEWHRVVAFGRLAEICGEYLKVGSQIYLEGRLRTRKFEDKEGRERYITEIVAARLQILDRKDSVNHSQPLEDNKRQIKDQTVEDFPPIDDEDLPF